MIAFATLYFIIGAPDLRLPVQLLISAVLCLFEVSLVLAVSAFTRNTLGTMAFALALIIIPAFIPFSQRNGIFNHIIALAAVRMNCRSPLLHSLITD